MSASSVWFDQAFLIARIDEDCRELADVLDNRDGDEPAERARRTLALYRALRRAATALADNGYEFPMRLRSLSELPRQLRVTDLGRSDVDHALRVAAGGDA